MSSQFPPPQRSQWPDLPTPDRKRSSNLWVLVGAVGAIVAAGVVWPAVKKAIDENNAASSAVSYRWSGGLCSSDDFSGKFTNTGSGTFRGRVWAVAIGEDGRTLARDEEVIVSLAPGATVTLEFVWSAEGVSKCAIESAERA